ncbi:MAG: hypothetical protein AAGI23_17830 [Bacteroidota bacterium]
MDVQRLFILLLILIFPLLGNAQSISNSEVNKVSRDSSRIQYEGNMAFAVGGESKLAFLFPRFDFLRKHIFEKGSFYYGAGLGLHLAFVAGYGSINGITGLEYRFLDVESSISHLRTTRIVVDENDIRGPFSQNLFHVKAGVKIKNVKLRVVRSFIISEVVPIGQDRIPLLDIGKINDNLWGVEVQITKTINEM